VLTAAEAGNARFSSNGLASLSLSPDEHVLAVTPATGAVVDLYMLHSLAQPGSGAQSFATWQLPPGEQAVQVDQLRVLTTISCRSVLGTFEIRLLDPCAIQQSCASRLLGVPSARSAIYIAALPAARLAARPAYQERPVLRVGHRSRRRADRLHRHAAAAL
jgi:hypothetical protein